MLSYNSLAAPQNGPRKLRTEDYAHRLGLAIHCHCSKGFSATGYSRISMRVSLSKVADRFTKLLVVTYLLKLESSCGVAMQPGRRNSVDLVRERTIPAEQPPLVGEVSADFCGSRALRGQHNGSLFSIF
jgi:hypothetical protein